LRAEDRKRLAGEQFGRTKNNISDNAQMCTLADKEKHPEHVPEPLANLTKNIYVYPIANYYKNVLDEKNDPEVLDWLFTC